MPRRTSKSQRTNDAIIGAITREITLQKRVAELEAACEAMRGCLSSMRLAFLTTPRDVAFETIKNCIHGIDAALSPAIAPHPERRDQDSHRLRVLLWRQHPCQGKYGDDGELQCNACFIDFKRDSIEEIEWKLAERSARQWRKETETAEREQRVIEAARAALEWFADNDNYKERPIGWGESFLAVRDNGQGKALAALAAIDALGKEQTDGRS